MSELASDLEPKALSPGELPPWEEHHGAKHNILCEYAKAWLPKLGQTYPQTAIVDGFASAGRYGNGRRGSPLVLLETYVEHSSRDALNAPPHFIFIESKLEFAQHLQHEVNALAARHDAEVDVIHGEYEHVFPRVIEFLARRYRGTLPTFAFVDPLGYENAPFDLLRSYRAAIGEKAEAMVYVPIRHMVRFAGTGGTEQALDRAFGEREVWEDARDAENASEEIGARFAGAYAEVMEGEFPIVSRFVVDPVSHNEYYLFFGTGHIDGLRVMKKAYWDTDPVGGTGYHQDRREARGQISLLDVEESQPGLPHEESLEFLVAEEFSGRRFTVDEVELFALTRTRFRETHVRKEALAPLQAEGRLAVISSTRTRSQDFPTGTLMRLTALDS